MSTITFKGDAVHTAGELPVVGSQAPDFKLTNGQLEEVGLDSVAGKKVILNIVPSLDTGICALSAQRFNADIAGRDDVVVLNISADLPFAAGRFCESSKLENIVPLSVFRAPEFGTDYGVLMTDGPLRGLLSRAVVVLDEQHKVLYTEQVPEIAQEPDYKAVLAAV